MLQYAILNGFLPAIKAQVLQSRYRTMTELLDVARRAEIANQTLRACAWPAASGHFGRNAREQAYSAAEPARMPTSYASVRCQRSPVIPTNAVSSAIPRPTDIKYSSQYATTTERRHCVALAAASTNRSLRQQTRLATTPLLPTPAAAAAANAVAAAAKQRLYALWPIATSQRIVSSSRSSLLSL
jgi:hypothetical protein